MSRKVRSVSYCIGVYNEEKTLKASIKTLQKELRKRFGKDSFEIVLVDNGSTDETKRVLSTFRNRTITSLSIPNKAHGMALRTAIEHAKYNAVLLTAADLPFGFSDLDQFLMYWDSYDIIFGSKAHPKSQIETSSSRWLASLLYRFFLKIFFRLPIRDPQGSIFLKKSKILPLLSLCTAENAFFTTQLALYAYKQKLKILEVPVRMSKKNLRKSKYSIFRDGRGILSSLIKERLLKHSVRQQYDNTTI